MTSTQHTGKKLTMVKVETFPILAVPDYGITKEAANYFKVRSQVSTEDGVTIEKTFFPYYSQSSKLVGYKVRDWTVARKSSSHITAVGNITVNCKLFGQVEAEGVKQAKKNLIFTEGEGDVIAGWQAVIDSVKGGKWEGKVFPRVVGLSLGTGNAVAATAANEEFIRSFDTDIGKIILAFDNDQATDAEAAKGIMRGKEAKEEVAGLLMTDNLFEYDFGEYKDLREMYLDGVSVEVGRFLTFDMKKYHPEKIMEVDDISFESLTAPKEEGFNIGAFPALMDKLHGFRKKELAIITSQSGVGKTSVVSEFAYDLAINHGQKIGMIYLEEMVEETTLRMLAKILKVNYNGSFKFNPLDIVSEKQFKDAMVILKGKMAMVDHFGSMMVESLIRKIKYLEHVNGCDFIFLDHISMVFSGSKETDERRVVDRLLTSLAAYVSKSNVGIIAISHLKNATQELNRDKDGNYLPTWIRVRKEDLRGSATLQQLPWTIIGVEGEVMPDRTRGRIRFVILKNRTWSTLGTYGVYRMDNKDGTFIEVEDDDEGVI